MHPPCILRAAPTAHLPPRDLPSRKRVLSPQCHSHPLLSLAFLAGANTWTYNSSGLHRRVPRRRGMDLALACRALRHRRLRSPPQVPVYQCVRALWGYRRSSLDFRCCVPSFSFRGITGNVHVSGGRGDKRDVIRARRHDGPPAGRWRTARIDL